MTVSRFIAADLLAVRVIAAGDAEFQEVGFRYTQRLVNGRNHLDDLIIEVSVVCLGDLSQVVVGDRLAVLI